MKRISIGLYNPITDTWIIASMLSNGNIPLVTFFDIDGVMVKLSLIKMSNSNKPLYEVKRINL